MRRSECYEVLGVRDGAPASEVKAAFRRRAKLVHPDINDSPAAHEAFVLLTEAYKNLREAHDDPLAAMMWVPARTPARARTGWHWADTATVWMLVGLGLVVCAPAISRLLPRPSDTTAPPVIAVAALPASAPRPIDQPKAEPTTPVPSAKPSPAPKGPAAAPARAAVDTTPTASTPAAQAVTLEKPQAPAARVARRTALPDRRLALRPAQGVASTRIARRDRAGPKAPYATRMHREAPDETAEVAEDEPAPPAANPPFPTVRPRPLPIPGLDVLRTILVGR